MNQDYIQSLKTKTKLNAIHSSLYGLLFIYGLHPSCDLYSTKSSSPPLLTLLFKIKTLLIMTALICYTFYGAFLTDNTKILYKISFHFKSWVVLITYVMVSRKLNKIETILYQIMKKISAIEMRRIKRIYNLLIIFWSLYALNNAMVFTYLALRVTDNNGNNNLYAAIRELLWAFYGFGWITASVLFLTYICYLLYLNETKFLQLFRLKTLPFVRSIDTTVTAFQQIQFQFMKLNQIKESINDCLGLLPFLWFMELFASTCLRITQISMESSGGQSSRVFVIIEYFYEYSMLICIYLIYILWISYFQSRRPTINELSLWLYKVTRNKQLSSAESQEKLSLVQQLVYTYNNCDYMACNVFVIDRKFVFGFLSAVVPFSVMVIQLVEQVSSSQHINTKI